MKKKNLLPGRFGQKESQYNCERKREKANEPVSHLPTARQIVDD